MSITDNGSIFFILGAGASFDSGLPTYRGPEGLYTNTTSSESPEDILSIYSPLDKVWQFLTPLYEKIATTNPGSTYDLIKELGRSHPNSFILTQNIDGHALSTEVPTVEIHGTWKTMVCVPCKARVATNLTNRTCKCGKQYRPDVVLYDQTLPQEEVQKVNSYIKTRPKYVVVIGTTLQFAYLRKFITKAKQRGAQVIHINPDDDYKDKVKFNEHGTKCHHLMVLHCLETTTSSIYIITIMYINVWLGNCCWLIKAV